MHTSYLKFNASVTNPQAFPLKPAPPTAFLISSNGESVLPVTQVKHTGIILNFYLFPHPICQ